MDAIYAAPFAQRRSAATAVRNAVAAIGSFVADVAAEGARGDAFDRSFSSVSSCSASRVEVVITGGCRNGSASCNTSSPTVLFILQRLRAAGAKMPCVALGFGPGLAAEAALFV